MKMTERRERYSTGSNRCNSMKETYQSIEFSAVKKQIAGYCAFELGAALIMDARPQFDALWIKRELRRCQQASKVLREQLHFPNDDILDISAWISRCQKDITLRPGELRSIASFIATCDRVKRFLSSCDSSLDELHDLKSSLLDHSRVRRSIEECISVEGEIYDHASEKLSTLRRTSLEVSAQISTEARRFISSHGSILMDTITALRNERTCVLVKVSEKNSVRGIIHGESASGQAVYLEPSALVALNNRQQALKSEEEQEMERILKQLTKKVREEALGLLANLDTMALLDALFAKAKWCNAKDGCIPLLNTKDHHLYLKEARHPLIPAERVVANTYELKPDIRCLLISGSNTGGKTVTLKTIALFVAMTHAGFPILCENAVVPLFRAICLDVGDQQSIQESLSTFSSHLSRLSKICEQADQDSFVILDELGSGTDPNEGECLAIAILEQLLSRKATIIASTHFAKVKSFANSREDVLLSCVAFDMETMTPTYHYLEGVGGQSNAFAIARRYHLNDAIVQRAELLKEQGQDNVQELMERLEKNAAELQQQKEVLHERLDEIQKLRTELQTEKNKLRRQQDEMLKQAMDEAKERYEQQLEQAEKIIAELRSMNENSKPHEVSEKLHELRELQPQQKEEETPAKEEEIHVGDYVQIRSLNYHGEVLSISKNKACVLANGMKMNVSLGQLEKTAKVKHEKKTKSKGYKKTVRSSSFPLECNLIGMRVDEALAVVDKYLDNAILNRAGSVRIVHGMGTGALRKAVHNYLKKQPKVESFRLGAQGEGGLGATIVELKQKGRR